MKPTNQKPQQGDCKTCSSKPNKAIFVDDVYHPVCPDCGKELIKTLDKHFPDEMDSNMYHPNMEGAVGDILKIISTQHTNLLNEVRELIENQLTAIHWSRNKDGEFECTHIKCIRKNDLLQALTKLKDKQ